MNINKKLYDSLIEDGAMVTYGVWPEDIESFLIRQNTIEQRMNIAINAVNQIMTEHGKADLHTTIVELSIIEHGIQQMDIRLRDHVVHSLMTFYLGIFIQTRFLKADITPFQWKLAALFHDIGYPIELAQREIINPYIEKINEIKRKFNGAGNDIILNIWINQLLILNNGLNSLDLIQAIINKWDLHINVKEEYNKMVSAGKICHGIISALSILYVIDLMYQDNNPKRLSKDTYPYNQNINWNQKNFENQVIPACAAIFIHNMPNSSFPVKINPKKAPLAYLLRLCDNIQEWGRGSIKMPKGISPTEFDISVVEGRMKFYISNEEISVKVKDGIKILENDNLIEIITLH